MTRCLATAEQLQAAAPPVSAAAQEEPCEQAAADTKEPEVGGEELWSSWSLDDSGEMRSQYVGHAHGLALLMLHVVQCAAAAQPAAAQANEENESVQEQRLLASVRVCPPPRDASRVVPSCQAARHARMHISAPAAATAEYPPPPPPPPPIISRRRQVSVVYFSVGPPGSP